jgi:hypothetical protein
MGCLEATTCASGGAVARSIAGHQPGAELAEHRGVKAGVGKLQAQGVVPVDAAADRIDCLAVRQPPTRRSWPDGEDPACRFAQGGSTALQGGALAGHGGFVHLLDAARAEHADQ